MSELVCKTLELLAENKGSFVSAVKNIFNTRTMATLKISDLSVGDWVELRGNIYTIRSIYQAIGSVPDEVVLSSKNISLGVTPVSELRPIPITAEILEKNGWERNEEDEYMEYYGDPTSGIAHTKGTYHYRLEVPDVSAVCYFVHQLQHALRLAGVDKEINL